MRRSTAAVFSKQRQRGLSLVEAAMAMVILGVAATLFWQVAGGLWTRANLTRMQSELVRAQAAVQAFAALWGRLPCPGVEPNGRESCDGRTEGYFPYLAVGMPEAVRLRYEADAMAQAPQGRFRALANDQAIDETSSPRAQTMALRPDLASSTYDGLLDLCEALSAITAGDRGVAYSLAQDGGPRLVSMAQAPLLRERPVHAAQVSAYLGCGPMVAVSGRGQYHAHLSAATMAKAIQDVRVQQELWQAVSQMEVAEGSWNVSKHVVGMIKSAGPALIALAKLKSELPDRPGLPDAIKEVALQAVSQGMGLSSLAARTSNLERYKTNLANFYNTQRVYNHLVEQSLKNYQTATRHAMLGGSSAYFLREQKETPVLGALPGPASNYGPNAVAQQIVNAAQGRAADLGHEDLIRDYATLPTDALPLDQLPPLPDSDIPDEAFMPELDGWTAPTADSLADADPATTTPETVDAQSLGGALDDLIGKPIDYGNLNPDAVDDTVDGAIDFDAFDPEASDAVSEKLDGMEKFFSPGSQP